MKIREYKSSDCNEIADLFYNTVHCINAKDYTEDQLNVWATGNIHIDEWNESFLNNYTVIAEENGIIIGFGDINDGGYLDRLYVHKDYQSIGVATAICDRLEKKYDPGILASHNDIIELIRGKIAFPAPFIALVNINDIQINIKNILNLYD